VVGLAGPSLSSDEESLIYEFPPAGVILFARNVSSAEQLESLASRLGRLIPDPLIMADHEGGVISVLADAVGVPPSQLAVGSVTDPEVRKAVYAETAGRLIECGVNTLLGPVADINTEPLNPVIGTRAFPGDASSVAALVEEAVTSFRKGGLLTCLKHFPGHGFTREDSHLALPGIPAVSDEYGRMALNPFRSGVKAGADMVMSGHLRAGESALPVSLDGPALDILRTEIGFSGVIITDALEMKGVREAAEIGQSGRSVAAEALKAGNDILLFSDPACEAFSNLQSELREAERRGRLSTDEIEEAAAASRARVSILKRRAAAVSAGMERETFFSHQPYLMTAEETVRVYGDTDSLTYPFSLRFAGERSDFSLRPVHYFIAEILKGLGIGGGDNFLDAAKAERYLQENLIHSSSGKGIMELREGSGMEGKGDILIHLFRKPGRLRDAQDMNGSAKAVVICGIIPPGVTLPADRPVIAVPGLFTAAGRAVSRILNGESIR